SVAKRRILTGINEVAAHTPRLDFLRRESCPFVLLEPQRTKLMLHSDAFDNAAWTKAGATIDVNVVNDPEGNALADKIVEDSSDGIHGIMQDKTKAASTLTYTIKFVVKAAEREWLRITVIDGSSNGYSAWFNATGSRGSFTQHGSGFSLLGYGIDEI